MIRQLSRLAVPAVMVLASTGAWAQSVISARSGTVHYVEGKVLIEDKAVVSKAGLFPEIKEGNIFRTEDGRAEIILTPGVFLRVGEHSSIRMITNRLTNTQIAVLKGSVLVECAELLKENAVTFLVNEKKIPVQKKGLFRIDAQPPLLRVYNGEAMMYADGHAVTVKDGRELRLDGVQLVAQKFNKEDDEDGLYRWAKRRAGYLAMANLSAARRVEQNSGMMSSWSQGLQSGWLFNPYLGMFTYLPYSGYYNSPFGYRFFSPYTIGRIYDRTYYGGGWNPYGSNSNGFNAATNSTPSYNSNLGYTTAPRTMDNPSYNTSTSSTAPAAAAPSSPGRSDGGGSRGSSSAGGHR